MLRKGLLLALLLAAVLAGPLARAEGGRPSSGSIQAAAAPPAAMALRPLGSIGGSVTAVEVAGERAYLSEGGDLSILDLALPQAPKLLGRARFGADILDLQVVGSRLYAVDKKSGFTIVDVSNATQPRLLSRTLHGEEPEPPGIISSYGQGIDVVGPLAYVGDAGLRIIDVSTPTSPTLLSTYPLFVEDVDVDPLHELAYVAASNSGLVVLDVSDPLSPALVSTFDTPYEALGVQVVGDIAYVVDMYGGLLVVNVSLPDQPRLLKAVSRQGSLRKVAVDGGLAYIVNSCSLDLIDVSSPSNAALLTSQPLECFGHDVQVVGERVYVANGKGGLRSFDISTPATPSAIGRYGSIGYAGSVAVLDGLAYVGDPSQYNSPGGGLVVVDLRDPARPTALSSYPDAGAVHDVQPGAGLLYLATKGGMEIVDVISPLTPTLLGRYTARGVGAGLTVAGGRAYLVTTRDLDIVDVTQVQTPTLLGAASLPDSYGQQVEVVGGTAYLLGGKNPYFRTYDVTTPTSPTLLSTQRFSPVIPSGLALLGDLAYAASEIVSVTNPLSPTIVGTLPLQDTPLDIQIAGDYAYVATWSGVEVLDVTSPLAPVHLASYALPSAARQLEVMGDRVLVADGDGGLIVLGLDEEAGYRVLLPLLRQDP